MHPSVHARALALVALLTLPCTFAVAQQAGFSSAISHLQANQKSLGLTPADIEALVVRDQHVSTPTGITHLYLQQQIDGVLVYNAIVNVAIAQDGRVAHVGNRAVPTLGTAFRSAAQSLSAEAAVEAAARSLGLEVTEPLRTVAMRQAAQEQEANTVRLTNGGIASEEIRAQLMYVPTEYGALQLAWIVEFYTLDGLHLWHMAIDAASGSTLFREDLVVEDHWDVDDYHPQGWPLPASADLFATSAELVSLAPLAESGSSLLQSAMAGSYRVYAAPFESPGHAGDPFADLRTLEANPADPTASPFGWHNTGTTQYTRTRGNNVHAYTDIDANNVADPGSDPDGGAGLVFDFPFDPSTQQPAAHRNAAVTNLFYWNNIIHDVMYQYGFTEAAGNFQVNTYDRGGTGNDDVRAEAQDGSGTNNANFGTGVDGVRPRMQMFVWNSPFVNVLTVGGQQFTMSGAGFGPSYPVAPGLNGTLVLVNDGVSAPPTGTPEDGCEPLVGFPAGSIAVAYRGNCPFTQKTANAQAAGAIAMVIVNNAPGAPITLGGADATIVIPAGMISQDAGATIVPMTPVAGNVRNLGPGALDRDSDFDNGVIVHEYGHGISNRLTGGRLTASCLGNQEQMGEGWSDYYALLLTDSNTEIRGVGSYVSYQATDGRGIRTYPYSRDFAVNPSTYDLIKTAAVPHGVGSVWATMLWDMTRNLVDRHGFDADVYAGTGGNNLSLQLVTEGLKLQACRPGFIDGRDAIMAADEMITESANQCLIWDSFARRGLGFSASQGPNPLTSSLSVTDGTEAFDLPISCSTVAMVSDQVSALQAAGVINKGQANSLLVKLQNAEKKIDQGQPSVALNMIDAFLNEVAALVRSRRLTTEQAQVLVEYADGLIARIQEFYPGAARSGEGMASSETLGAKSAAGVPEEFALNQNYPNPFAATTQIDFALPEAAHVKLVVYDVMGREVARLVDGDLSAGFYQATLDGSRLASGTYLYRIEAGSFVSVQRMVLVK